MKTRLLTTVEEFHEAVCLQKQIWQFADVELLPVRLFVVASKIGGQSYGAFDGDRMVAFTLAIPGLKRNRDGSTKPYLHSHMLGVLEGYRDRGVGRMLKFAQRQKAIEDGFDLMEWTFDPLELKNAFFNIERLGAVVRRYVLNQYGVTSSQLHAGLPTDRCVAEWRLTEERPARPPIEERIEVRVEGDRREIQRGVSERFVDCFARGLTVVGFEKPGTYLLGRLCD